MLSNKGKRQVYKCFVPGCNKSYYYVCTLKKHFENNHSYMLTDLEQKYDTCNFTDIYRQCSETEYTKNIYISRNNTNMIDSSKVKVDAEKSKTPQELEHISKLNQLAFLKQAIVKATAVFNETRCQMERLKHVRNELLSRKRNQN